MNHLSDLDESPRILRLKRVIEGRITLEGGRKHQIFYLDRIILGFSFEFFQNAKIFNIIFLLK
jgi:hypothetical protein